jgi:hypothetical protein
MNQHHAMLMGHDYEDDLDDASGRAFALTAEVEDMAEKKDRVDKSSRNSSRPVRTA